MIQTTYHVDVDDIHEYPSMAVMQTNFIATDIVIKFTRRFQRYLDYKYSDRQPRVLRGIVLG